MILPDEGMDRPSRLRHHDRSLTRCNEAEASARRPRRTELLGCDMTEPTQETESDHLVREFVSHWGLMARAWGINSTMGELFALLYITGAEWTAEDLRVWLGVSRGNVSMNLRELLAWGVVHKIHRTGKRRELFRAEADVWTLFRKILTERKRRELDPSLRVLDRHLTWPKKTPRSKH